MKETKVKKDQIPINFSFISNKGFNNYVIGKNNFIVKTLEIFAKDAPASIIFLKGNKSSGKSHLCLSVIALSNKSICFLNKSNVVNVELDNILSHDLLIIDDIDQIISEYSVEEKLFSAINDFILNKKNILVTSTKALDDIKFNLLDLYSRLKWDQVLQIPELTDDDKIKVLQKIARERGWELPAHVCDYILRHYKRDLYFLCNCIKFLDEASLSLKKKITIPFIKKIIEYR